MARKKNIQSIKKPLTIYISCEDEAGGYEYIKSLIRAYGFTPKNSCSKHFTDIKNLVEQAKHSDGNLRFVFVDVDDKTNSVTNRSKLNDAIQIAKSHNICIIVSNECLELWYLLHFENQTAYIDRQSIFSKLKNHLLTKKSKVLTNENKKSLQEGKLKGINFYNIFDEKEMKIALNRCRLLIKNAKSYSSADPWTTNPLTLMCCFIELLEMIKNHNNNINYIKNAIKKCYPTLQLADK